MAWSAPFTAVAGNIILASGHNTGIRDNLNYLKGVAGTIAFDSGATFGAAVTAAGQITALDSYVWSQSITASPSEIGFRIQRSGSDADTEKVQWVNQAGTGGWEAIMPASLTTWQLSQIGVGVALELESGASGLAQFSRLVRSTKASINSLSATSYLDAQIQASAPTGVPGVGLTKSDVATGVLIYHNGLASGANILRMRGSNNGDWTVFSSGNMGAASGLDAATLDTLVRGNASGNIPVSNGVLNVNLNADLLDGLTAGHAANQIPWSEAGVLNTGLRAEFGDKLLAGGLGHVIAGNGSNQIPVSNGVVNTNLNADLLDGLSSAAFALLTGAAFSGAISGTTATFTGAVTGSRFAFDTNNYIQPTGANDIAIRTGDGTPRYTQTNTLATFSTPGVYATSWTASSDRRLKRDILVADGGLAAIRRLQPITYVHSAEHRLAYGWSDERRRHGLIAQDVRAVLPDMIEGSETDGDYLSIDYPRLVVPLIAAVQELADRVDTISARLAS